MLATRDRGMTPVAKSAVVSAPAPFSALSNRGRAWINVVGLGYSKMPVVLHAGFARSLVVDMAIQSTPLSYSVERDDRIQAHFPSHLKGRGLAYDQLLSR